MSSLPQCGDRQNPSAGTRATLAAQAAHDRLSGSSSSLTCATETLEISAELVP